MLTFVLSHGRTGTVFLNNLISSLPNVSSYHERHGNFLRIFYHMRYDGIDNRLINKFALKLITNSLDKYNNNQAIHIEINNQIKYYVNDVLKKFPNAKYIHIVRDPREHVVSGVNWTMDKPLNKLFKLYFPFWSPRPKHYSLGNDDISKIFEITNINWFEVNSTYIKLKEKTSNYILLKFEDFLKDQLSFVQKILKLAGYDKWNDVNLIQDRVDKSFKNKSTSKVFPKWQKWEDKYVLYIHQKCEKLMSKFGYGMEDEWRQRVDKALKRNG